MALKAAECKRAELVTASKHYVGDVPVVWLLDSLGWRSLLFGVLVKNTQIASVRMTDSAYARSPKAHVYRGQFIKDKLLQCEFRAGREHFYE